MSALETFFMFCAMVVPAGLVIWSLLSSLGRIARVLEDIAVTLRRMEQSGPRQPGAAL